MKPVKLIPVALVMAFFSVILVTACHKSDSSMTATDPVAAVLNLPATPFNYSNPSLPAYLTIPPIQGQINNSSGNPVTDNGATLGRVLFYDKNLSVNNKVACASCHKQLLAFADTGAKSFGFKGGLTKRNSMGLTDAAYYPNGRYFWDQRAASLEAQVVTPIQDTVEMGMTLPQLVAKLSNLAYYPPLFQKAFGDNAITSDRIARALAQFVKSIVSYQSKFDAGRATLPVVPPPPPNAPFLNFTPDENRGKEIFFSNIGGCNACHGTETFTAPQEKNNGLDATTIDKGYGNVTGNPADDATFKVTSLRNVELTSPYMHDGRFKTLEEVIEHYSTGVQNHPNLSQQLKLPNGQPRNLNLSAADKAALVAFLKTLTDLSVTTDVKYANPFK